MIGSGWSAEKRQKSDELLRRHSYRHLLVKHQRPFYDMVHESKEKHFGLYSSRKIGKSFMLFIIALEFAQRNPGTICRIILPNKTQAREIYSDIYQQLRSALPIDLTPKYLKMEGAFQFTNGSRVILGGSQPDNCESLRGPLTHLLLRDEICSWDASNYEYVNMSILIPQGTTVPDFKIIDASTPPRTPTHPWIMIDYKKLLMRDCLITLNIYDNSLLTPQMVDNIIDTYGGVDDSNFCREHLCQLIPDGSLRLVPEFNDTHVGADLPLSDNFGNFETFQSIVSIDMGLVDNTFITYGYHDHIRDLYVILGEWADTRKSYGEIKIANDECKVKYISGTSFLAPIEICDVWEHARHSMNVDHNWQTQPPSKGRTEETIAYLRDCFKNNRIMIHPRCVGLINELKTAIWNDQRTEIKRDSKQLHADGVMSLAYGAKAVIFGRRPDDIVGLVFRKLSIRRKK